MYKAASVIASNRYVADEDVNSQQVMIVYQTSFVNKEFPTRNYGVQER